MRRIHVLMAGVSCAGLAGVATAAPPEARALLEANPDLDAAPGALLVRFAPGIGAQQRDVARGLVAGTHRKSFKGVPGLELIDVGVDRDKAIKTLQALPIVEYAEPDYVLHPAATPNDEFFSVMWGLHNTGQTIQGNPGVADADIDAPQAWDTFTGDASFIVAIIDTGTQYSHPDLNDNIWSNTDEIGANGVDDDGNGYVDDIRGWDFYSDDNDPDDTNGHGTHTAGTVGAEGDNGIGVTGVNWQCSLMALRFLGPQGGFTSDAIEAVSYAAANGAKVSNNSWGGGGFSSALRDAIANAGASGHVFVAAAGNNGANNDASPFYPASYNVDTIISVAATNNQDGLASFSNYGSSSVDIGAPGVDIGSTYSGSNYVYLSGTSMACPHVAGVVALVYASNPGWSAGEVIDRVLSTARPVASLNGKTVTGGMVNAAAALEGVEPPPPVTPPAAPGTPSLADSGNGVVHATWADNSNDEDGFEVQREKQKKNGSWVGTAIVGSTGADDNDLDDESGGGTFRYRVRAFNTGGSSAWSGWAEITVAGGGGGGGNGNGNGKGNGGGPPG